MISKAIDSDISQLLLANKLKLAEKKALNWKSIFGNRYYMAAQRTDRPDDEQQLHLTVDLGLALDIPVVATNDVQFLDKDDYQAHEARICIAEGGLLDDARRLRRFSESQFLKSADEMVELFVDFPSLLKNTVEISKRCNLHFELFEKNHLPVFPTPKDCLSLSTSRKNQRRDSEKDLRVFLWMKNYISRG
jgi:DNA polymerase-3 subunit alpha